VAFIGQKIVKIDPDSQAQKLGLKPKMRILSVNGTRIRSHELLDKLLGSCKVRNQSYEMCIMQRSLVLRKDLEKHLGEEEAERAGLSEFFRKRGVQHLGFSSDASDDGSAIEEDLNLQQQDSDQEEFSRDNKRHRYSKKKAEDEVDPKTIDFEQTGKITPKQWQRLIQLPASEAAKIADDE